VICEPGAERELDSVVLPCWGAVVEADGVVPWLVVDDAGAPVEPIRRFLRDFVARGNRAGSVRSYAYGLLRWWRWLIVAGVEWDKATSAEVRDLVLWLARAQKPRRSARTASAATAGTVNPVTRKRYLDDSYQPRTVRHSNAVIRSFYEFWIEAGGGPLINPVPLDRRGGRVNAHHNPLEPFRAEGRIRYNPKVPRQRPREIPDTQWLALFGSLRSNRDRALLAVTISNGARASEILGLRGTDLDWGEQQIRVVRKGTQAEQWLPASPEAFIWIRLYLAEIGAVDPGDPLWVTLRRRCRTGGPVRVPLTYEALRAVFRRVNAVLGTNWTMHDLRHTCSLRMARDSHLSLRDVQVILGHAHLSTTETYMVEEEDAVIRRVLEHLGRLEQREAEPALSVVSGYDAADLTVLFSGTPS
jgi:integrase/recombinase XerD